MARAQNQKKYGHDSAAAARFVEIPEDDFLQALASISPKFQEMARTAELAISSHAESQAAENRK